MEGPRPQPEKKRMIYVAAGTALLAAALTTGLAVKAGVGRVIDTTFYVDQQLGGCSVFVVNMPDKTQWDDDWGDVTRHADLVCALPRGKTIKVEAQQTFSDSLTGAIELQDVP